MGTYTDQTWYHIARTPDGDVHVHRLAPGAVSALADASGTTPRESAEAEAVGRLTRGVEQRLGFPADAEQVMLGGWSANIGPGEPHHTIVAAAVNVKDGHIPDA